MSTEQVLLDLATPALAVVTGICYFKQLNRLNRYLLFQTLFYIITDFSVAGTQNNGWMYNINILVEMGLILLGLRSIFHSKKMQYLFASAYSIFVVSMLIDINVYGFALLAQDAIIVQYLLLSGILIYVLYKVFLEEPKWSLVMACTGMLLYFACTIPYLCILSYLQQKNADLNQEVFQYIMVLSQAVRYFMLAVAFGLQVYEQRKAVKPI